jgi:hypothetical protein
MIYTYTHQEITIYFTSYGYRIVSLGNAICITNTENAKQFFIPRQKRYSIWFIKILFYIHQDALKQNHKFSYEQLRHYTQLNRFINQSKNK